MNKNYPNEWWFNDDHRFSDCITVRRRSKSEWDSFFMDLALRTSKLSKCASRKVGAILVRDNLPLSIGFNGAPARTYLCQNALMCPRKELGFPSGKGIEYCPAQHAEENAINNAAKHGISTNSTTIYCYCGLPCQHCAGTIINAGIIEVVCLDTKKPDYDNMASTLFYQAGVVVRRLRIL